MTEIITRRLNAWLYPPQILEDPHGGIMFVAARMPNLDAKRRALSLIVDVQALGLQNPSIPTTDCLEQVIGHFAPMLVQKYDLAPDSQIHWIEVDRMGAFDVIRPDFPMGAWRYKRVNAVSTPLRCAPGAPRTAVAFCAAFPEVGEMLLRCAMELAGCRGEWRWAAQGAVDVDQIRIRMQRH